MHSPRSTLPELPEVETVRRDLEAALAGSSVARVSVTGARSTRRHATVDSFARSLTGRRLIGFDRRGKYLLIALEPAATLVAHLRMSGQLRLEPGPEVPLARHSHVVIGLADGRELRFVDPRTFGELFVTTPALPELAGLGVDALAVTRPQLAGLLTGRRAGLKAFLLDQRRIAGIGNIYSDEILWTARLRGMRPGGSLRPAEVRRLHTSVVAVLEAAVEGRGSSLRDAQYVDLDGRAGTYQQRHAVYGREGLPCPRCGRPVARVTVAQRSHFWCRGCQ
ncbi:MAG: bifunctional DNA-formamidopyrimidine glycosylase/DNA-(apurinic or apyrimidinic site) lyase [Acidimicrobiales bacterium]